MFYIESYDIKGFYIKIENFMLMIFIAIKYVMKNVQPYA